MEKDMDRAGLLVGSIANEKPVTHFSSSSSSSFPKHAAMQLSSWIASKAIGQTFGHEVGR